MKTILPLFFILYGALIIYVVYINEPVLFLRITVAALGFLAVMFGISALSEQTRNK